MKPDEVRLDRVLADFPHLRQALGERWIRREQQTDPVLSRFPLARTLRIAELRHLVATLDRMLGAFAAMPEAADWRKRLQCDGEGFREILTELTYASLLRAHGFAFRRPEKGADFLVEISDGHFLPVEVTTPRKVAWADDLTTRLIVLGQRFGYAVRVEPLVEGSPILDVEIREKTVQIIVQRAIAQFENAMGDADAIEQIWDTIGLRITWKPAQQPGYYGTNSSYLPPIQLFNYLVEAAHEKSRQLPRGEACALIVGTNQLPFPGWEYYLIGLRNQDPFHGPFDWSLFPDQLRYLILYSASYADTHPPKVDVVIRSGDALTDPPGIDHFIGAMVRAGEAGLQRRTKIDELIEALA